MRVDADSIQMQRPSGYVSLRQPVDRILTHRGRGQTNGQHRQFHHRYSTQCAEEVTFTSAMLKTTDEVVQWYGE